MCDGYYKNTIPKGLLSIDLRRQIVNVNGIDCDMNEKRYI